MKHRDERGAVAVFTAFLLVVLVGIVAIVVDLGMERVTRADLQALADVVALDLAREIRGGRTQASLAAEGNLGDPSSAVSKSAARNSDILGTDLTLEVDWGSYDNEVWNTATDPPSAVRVIASAETEYSVMEGTGAVTRTAFAAASNSACYRLGTFVAAVRTGDSTVVAPLNYLLGVNLDLVSYRALADADVTLGDLAATSVIGSPTQLMTGTVTYSNLIRATIQALSNEPGSSNSAAISALNTILAASGTVGAVSLGDVFHASPTDQAALGMAINVLDIVGSARLATGEHFIDIDNLQAGVPGVGFQFTGGLVLISAAQLACGLPNSPESVAQNTQLEGDLGITFANMPSLSVPSLGTLQTAKGTGSLHVSIADGTGQLVSPPEVHCGSGTAADPHRFSVAVQTQAASYALSSNLQVNGDVKVADLQALGLGSLLTGLLGILLPTKVTVEVDVRLDVATTSPAKSSIATLTIPPNDVTPVETGTTPYLDPSVVVPTVVGVKINGKTSSLAGALPMTNLIVNELIGVNKAFAQKTLVPLIDHFNTKLIGPVARMVGLRFGGADVYAIGAVCGQPSLWG